MRHMAFSLTTPQMLNRSKSVTRRVGWRMLKAGDLIQAIEKGQGLKAGAKVRKLAVLRIVDVRRERLRRLVDDPIYGRAETTREGFDGWPGVDFVQMFCDSHDCAMSDEITRIQFEFVETVQ